MYAVRWWRPIACIHAREIGRDRFQPFPMIVSPVPMLKDNREKDDQLTFFKRTSYHVNHHNWVKCICLFFLIPFCLNFGTSKRSTALETENVGLVHNVVRIMVCSLRILSWSHLWWYFAVWSPSLIFTMLLTLKAVL